MGGRGITGNQNVLYLTKTVGVQFGEIDWFGSSQGCLEIIQTKVLQVVFFSVKVLNFGRKVSTLLLGVRRSL